MKVYVVEHIYGVGTVRTAKVVGVYNHISKAGFAIWELILNMYDDSNVVEDNIISVNDIIKSREAWYRINNNVEGKYVISEHEVL